VSPGSNPGGGAAEVSRDRPIARRAEQALRCSTERIRPCAALWWALDQPELAARVAADAVTASRQRNTRPFLGRELVVLADARARLDHDRDDVGRLLAEARSIADATGVELVRREAAACAKRHGVGG
jgi:hypothetical protein